VIGLAIAGVVAVSGLHCAEQVTADNIGEKLTEALCGAWNNCCAKQGKPLSDETMQRCEAAASFDVYRGEGYIFHPEAAEVCLKAARAYDCRGMTTIAGVCRNVFTDPSITWTPSIYNPEGARCGGVWGGCAFYDGVTCVIDDLVAQTGTCQKLRTTGGVCIQDTDCVFGNYCDATQTCALKRADGAACTSTSECMSSICTFDFVCVPSASCVNY
jgi:hypothetical protein